MFETYFYRFLRGSRNKSTTLLPLVSHKIYTLIMNTNNNLLIKTIRAEVEERQAFLDPGLTLASLAIRCRTNRTYVSSALMELGGFFNYINHLRLSFADNWKKAHPNTTLEQVALASGFHSRQTFYNVRRQLVK